jgi:p-aminobenzoyl-glutamate transporter AbgT
MAEPGRLPGVALQRLLDAVERAGNKVPHFVSWTPLFFAWYFLGLPFGPG